MAKMIMGMLQHLASRGSVFPIF